MSWLTPIGFLGLSGLIVLILIYIIKPNYQNKIISSTFVWKLSLKYKKNKLPISKLRNVLLFLCQVLIITICAFILAQPFINEETIDRTEKKVYIIDASASMMTQSGGITRFDRAVEAIRADATELLKEDDSEISIIVAHDEAKFLAEKIDKKTSYMLDGTLDTLVTTSENNSCTWGTPDIDGAIKLSERITSTVPDVEVVLYTDSSYIDPGEIKVVSMIEPNEWNAAILDVRANLVENTYVFEFDVVCYGNNRDINFFVDIVGTDVSNNAISLEEIPVTARCEDGVVTTATLSARADTDPNSNFSEDIKLLASYNSLYVFHNELDSFDADNSFHLYGGEKLPLRIQYYSALPNNFYSTALLVLRDRLKGRWNVDFKEVKANEEPANEGFDVYIYEHVTPSILPTDGVVILANPSDTPVDGGYSLNSRPTTYAEDQILEAGDAHPITNMITASNITLTMHTAISNYDLYTPLLYCNDDPVLLVMDTPESKVVLMPFSINYSNLPVVLEFPLLLYNIIEYFIPSTVREYVYDIGEDISLVARGEDLTVGAPNGETTKFTEFPSTINLSVPGTYALVQTPISGVETVETIFVKLSAEESNIYSEFDSLSKPYYYVEEENTTNKDLLLYFAMALVALLFCEWWLHTREYK